MSQAPVPSRRIPHRWLYALPELEMPAEFEAAGARYEHVRTFKHDFFAATGLYRGADGGLVVLKVGRRARILGLPGAWIGRILAGREAHMYERAAGIPGVPKSLGRVGPTGFAHAFAPGRPLDRHDTVPDTFFDELRALVDELHARDMAYVDLNKPQNVILGEDGKPALIDFQIACAAPRWRFLRALPWRWLLRRCQAGDIYHVYKHKRRLRPDLLTAEEAEVVERATWSIRAHRFLTRPLTRARRRLLSWLKRGERGAVAGSEAK